MTPTQKAAALKYAEETDRVPVVVAKGKGEIANKIMQKASEFGIPLFKNELLADSLLNIDIDEQIPPHLYKAVVEVFVWLSKNEQGAVLDKRLL